MWNVNKIYLNRNIYEENCLQWLFNVICPINNFTRNKLHFFFSELTNYHLLIWMMFEINRVAEQGRFMKKSWLKTVKLFFTLKKILRGIFSFVLEKKNQMAEKMLIKGKYFDEENRKIFIQQTMKKGRTLHSDHIQLLKILFP